MGMLYIESFANTLNTIVAVAIAIAKFGKYLAMSIVVATSALVGKGTTHMPRLSNCFSFDNLGVEAYFHGWFLVVESVNGKGRKSSFHFTHPFQPQH
jgi:hypothetical protein